jgi:hypothetical protein
MRLNAEKPLGRLQEVVRLLGWRSCLRLCQHRVTEQDAPPDLRGNVITWYEVGIANGNRSDCFLQINESPQGQTITYTGAVYAIRYRICTGWHKFRLLSDDDELKREATRLATWLAWDWFASIEKRRAFRQAYPECVGHGWRTIRDNARSGRKDITDYRDENDLGN